MNKKWYTLSNTKMVRLKHIYYIKVYVNNSIRQILLDWNIKYQKCKDEL